MPAHATNNAIEFFGKHTYDQVFYGRKMSYQMYCMNNFKLAEDGDVKYRALRMFIWLTWPEFVKQWEPDPKGGIPIPTLTDKWNPWLERNLRTICATKYASKRGKNIFRVITLTGCAGAGKTHFAGLYTDAWWMSDMQNSIATLTSTTKDMIGQRIWPVVSHFWETAVCTATNETFAETDQLGDKVDSSRIIRAAKGDDKHAITALAVAHGETQKAIHNLKGRHAPRMLLVIDEANGTPEAIFEVIPNMRKGCEDLTVLVIGNPGSRFDPHGRCLAPKNGWPTITKDVYEWETEAVKEWQLDPGIALRFDGFDSPNVKAGRTRWPYIYTLEDKESALHTPDYVGTLNYWVMDRGLHPPEGTACTVFTEQLFSRILDNSELYYIWEGEVITIAFLDPAFTSGGDSCWLQFAKMGMCNGKYCLQLIEGFEIPISPDVEAYDIDYQIARRTIQECRTRNVRPEHFGLDATAIGRGVGAIIAAEWSSAICYTQWGGSASDLPSAQNDGRPSSEVYYNKVSEYWFAVRECLESGQIRGFTNPMMTQACCRLYEMSGKKYKLEPKGDMRSRVASIGSPDEMDGAVGCVIVARRAGLEITGKIATLAAQEWNNQSKLDIYGLGDVAEQEVAVHGDAGWAEPGTEDAADGDLVIETGTPW